MGQLFQRLMGVRGVDEEFLHPRYEDLPEAFLLPDMRKAVERLKAASTRGERVLIYGDYDVDGVTASTIMKEILGLIGISEVSVMLPDRFADGYGMSSRVVEEARRLGVGLVVTVDCGSNNSEVIAELAAAGVDVVVTDHHELSTGVPEAAVAVVNPKREDFVVSGELDSASGELGSASGGVGSASGELQWSEEVGSPELAKEVSGRSRSSELQGSLRELCGAGVAFFVARALVAEGLIPEGREKWLLDLVVIGTECDSMVITGVNRILCHFGLIVLAKTRRVGLLELMKVAGVKNLSTEVIGYQLGPRLNASGRMASAELSLRLLLARSRAEAAGLAVELDRLNSERKKQQNEAVRAISEAGISEEPVIVVAGKWHEGVAGIIAGRLSEKYRRPAFVLTEVDGDFKGSGRSFGDFNLALACRECQDCLISGGGHAGACGVRVSADKVDEFRERINEYYQGLGLTGQEKYFEVQTDLAVSELSELSMEFLEEMALLEPYGNGNPEPVFLLSGVTVLEVAAMGEEGKHLRLMVKGKDGKIMKLVGFFAREEWFKAEVSEVISVVVNLVANEWNGATTIEGRILDIKK